MKPYTFWDKVKDTIMFKSLLASIEYYFAKRWLDSTFGTKEYWGEVLTEALGRDKWHVPPYDAVKSMEIGDEVGFTTNFAGTEQHYILTRDE